MSALIIAVFFSLCGLQLMSNATAVAIRWKTSVWKSARPEFGGGVVLMALGLLFAAVGGGWL